MKSKNIDLKEAESLIMIFRGWGESNGKREGMRSSSVDAIVSCWIAVRNSVALSVPQKSDYRKY